MHRKCRVTVGDSTFVGEIGNSELKIGGTEIDVSDLVKIRNLGGDRRGADLKKGTVLEYRIEEASGFLELSVPGIKGITRIDFTEVRVLESLKKG